MNESAVNISYLGLLERYRAYGPYDALYKLTFYFLCSCRLVIHW